MLTQPSPVAPFPGLRPFSSDLADFFFGRENQTEAILERLEQHRFLMITGSSGSGKSSLVRAGLIPALSRGLLGAPGSGWKVVVSSPGTAPIVTLANRIGETFGRPATEIEPLLRRSSLGLAEAARACLPAGQNLFVLIDQFEEIFRYRSEGGDLGREESYAFVQMLLAASGQGQMQDLTRAPLPVYVVLTMRSDFLGVCARFAGLPEALSTSQYVVPKMSRDQHIEAIEGPVSMAGAEITPRLVQRLLNDLERDDSPDQLPILQHALLRTWELSAEARGRGESIDLEHYDRTGRVERALNQDADAAFAELGSARLQEIARRMFQRLVTKGAPIDQIRRPTQLKEMALVAGASQSEITEVIGTFRKRGFLVIAEGADPDNPIVDISHESLIRLWQRLASWTEAEAASAQIYRRLVESAELDRAAYRNPELQQVLDWRQREQPNADWAQRYTPDDGRSFARAMVFLDRSRRRRQGAVAVSLLVVSVLSVAIVVIVYLWRSATDARDQALARELATQAISDERDEKRSLNRVGLIAAESQMLMPSADADAVLRRVLGQLATPVSLLRQKMDDQGSVRTVTFDRSGRYVATGGDDKAAHVFDATTGKEIARLRHGGVVRSVAFSPNGELLGTGADDGVARVFKLDSRPPRDEVSDDQRPVFEFSHDGKKVKSVAFSPDSRTFATGADDSVVRVFDLEGKVAAKTVNQADTWIARVVFSPDGSTLAIGGGDGTVTVIDVTSGRAAVVPAGHTAQIQGLAFSADGRILATAALDKTARAFDASTLHEVGRILGERSMIGVALSSDGRFLLSISAGQDGVVTVFDLNTQRSEFIRFPFELRTVAASEEGNYFAIGGDDMSVRVYAIREGKPVVVAQGDTLGRVLTLAFGSGHRVAAAGNSEIAWVFDVRSNVQSPDPPIAVSEMKSSFSRASGYLASGDRNGMLRIYDAGGTPIGQPLATGSPIYALSMSVDSVAVASQDQVVRVFDVRTGNERMHVKSDQSVNVLAFSHDGKYLAVGAVDSSVTLFDIRLSTLQWLKKISDDDQTRSLKFSPDDRTIVMGTFQGVLASMRTRDGNRSTIQTQKTGEVNSLAFSPNGHWLAVGIGTSVELYDFNNLARIPVPAQLDQEVVDLDFSPNDGQTLAVRVKTTNPDATTVQILGVPQLTAISRIQMPPSLLAIAFHSDGQRLLVASSIEGRVAITNEWLRSAVLVREVCSRLSWTFSGDEWGRLVKGQTNLRACADTVKPAR